MRYGSDLIVGWLAELGIEHVALNPGATLRGLHDSLARAANPDLIMTLHEEVAIGIAHGYAKATGRPMAAFVHDLVGLQHASMALFNAWVDRAPMLVLGGSGPRAEDERRPWLDWIHTGHPQSAIVREFVKWDAEPVTMPGVRDALQRGLRMAGTGPAGPVYLSIDAGLQEAPVPDHGWPALLPLGSQAVTAPDDSVAEVAELLARASRPVIIVDLPVRGLTAPLVRIAEDLAAAVVDLGGGANFPTTHWADQSQARRATLAEADAVLAIEVRDLAFALTETNTGTRGATPLLDPAVPVVSVSLSELRYRGFLVPEALVPETRYVIGDAVDFVDRLVAAVASDAKRQTAQDRRETLARRWRDARQHAARAAADAAQHKPVHPAHLAASVKQAISDGPWQLANGHLGRWLRALWDVTEESQYLGRSGGHGLGYGLPASLGAALAARDSDTLVVDIQSDGDLMYTASALWTAAHHRLPLLIVMHNNRSYGKDEHHQTEVAAMRHRSADVVPIGIRLEDPVIDFAALARAQGVDGIGPVENPGDVAEVIAGAAAAVRTERRTVLVDVVCDG